MRIHYHRTASLCVYYVQCNAASFQLFWFSDESFTYVYLMNFRLYVVFLCVFVMHMRSFALSLPCRVLLLFVRACVYRNRLPLFVAASLPRWSGARVCISDVVLLSCDDV